MKKATALILSAAILICAPAGCSNGKSSSSSEAENSAAGETVEETTKPAPEIDKTGTKIYWRMDYKTDNVTATFINSTTGEKKEAGLEVVDETDEYRTYACWGDADKYNKVCFTYNEKSTKEVAFNKLVSGWHNSSHYGIVPYTEGGDDSESVYETKKFNCMGYEKEVYVWTPKDYDANSKDKYSVIYLLDGQNMLNRKTGDSGSWDVGKSVESMMAQSGNKAIIVAIATPEYTRNSELVPDFGEPATEKEKYDKREGIPFADFVVKTVVPYIEQNYNVYTDAEHNSVAGSSLGGLESFYIGMEHPEKFGTIGAMSPSFWMYGSDFWLDYVGKKEKNKNCPFVYLYAGGSNDNESYALMMKRILIAAGHPSDKMFYNVYDKGAHLVPYWRYIFPEFLKYMFINS